MSLLLIEMLCLFVLQEKLLQSNSRIEVSLGKKLVKDMLPEIEKEHKVPICSILFYFIFLFFMAEKFLSTASFHNGIFFSHCQRKEKLLKKQHRQALLLDNFMVVDGLGAGRSLRDRKPVRYTFGNVMTLLEIRACGSSLLAFFLN